MENEDSIDHGLEKDFKRLGAGQGTNIDDRFELWNKVEEKRKHATPSVSWYKQLTDWIIKMILE